MSGHLYAFGHRFALRFLEPLGSDFIAAVPIAEKSRYTPDRRNTHASEAMNLTIRDVALEVIHDGPPISHRLELGGRAEVAEERPHLVRRLQRSDRHA
jgi:hypothetical protein